MSRGTIAVAILLLLIPSAFADGATTKTNHSMDWANGKLDISITIRIDEVADPASIRTVAHDLAA